MGDLAGAPGSWNRRARVDVIEGEGLHQVAVQHSRVHNVPGCVHERKEGVVGAAVAAVLAVVEHHFNNRILPLQVDF